LVTVKIEVTPELNLEQLFVPPMLLQPFIENSLWHGFHQGITNPTLVIGIEQLPDSWLLITITDNGIGRIAAKSVSSENHVSRGIEICRQRIQNFNSPWQREPVVYTDLNNGKGNSLGTRVSLYLKMNP
jgi:LytS/YehU family sensor histidine kinase